MWKLAEKLKKLKNINKPNKGLFLRYLITINKDDFYQLSNIIAYNINLRDTKVQFKTSMKGLKLLNRKIDNDKFETIDLFKLKYSFLIKSRIIMLCSLLLIGIITLTTNLFIREITFENDDYYDYEIYQEVKSQLSSIGPLYKLDININELNQKLRNSYPQFAYIGVRKVSSKLVIIITKEEVPKQEIVDENIKGDIISLYDGYITSIICRKGVVVISNTQTVKKGELLISGNINYFVDPSNLDRYTHADGIVIGKTVVYKTITIEKQRQEIIYTGNVNNYYIFSFFNYDKVIGSTSIRSGYCEVLNIFKLGRIVSLNKIKEYEQNEITINYTKENAVNYAKSKVIDEFNRSKVSDLEKIESIEIIKIEENNNVYNVSLRIKYIINFGQFKEKE